MSMTLKEKSQVVELLTHQRVRNYKRMQQASGQIDKMRRKVKGESCVGIIRRFRGAI